MILCLFNHYAALVPLTLSPLLVHLVIPLWKSTTALSAIPHLVSGMNFPKNFANLSMMSPCHSHGIFLSSVHHYHHHYHHFHYVSLHLCSTPDSKLTFSINTSHRSLPHLYGRISRMTISGQKCSFFVLLFHLFVWFVWQTKLLLSAFELHVKSLHFPSFLSYNLQLDKQLLLTYYIKWHYFQDCHSERRGTWPAEWCP